MFTSVQERQVQFLLDCLSHITGHTYSMINGICSLADTNGKLTLILEVLPNENALLLAKPMSKIPSEPTALASRATQLLAINAQPTLMRGSWFAINEDALTLLLLKMLDLSTVSEESFLHVLADFFDLAEHLYTWLEHDECDVQPIPYTIA